MSRVFSEPNIKSIFSPQAPSYVGIFKPLVYVQRGYEWKAEKNTGPYLASMTNAFKNRNGCFDIGDVSFTPDPENRSVLYIVDGFQRMTTFMLLMSALKEYFSRLDDKQSGEIISKLKDCMYVDGDVDTPDTDAQCRIQMDDIEPDIQTLFKALVDGKKVQRSAVDSITKQNLLKAKKLAVDWVEQVDAEGGRKLVLTYTKYLLNNVYGGQEIESDFQIALERFIALNSGNGVNLSPESIIKDDFVMAMGDIHSPETPKNMGRGKALWGETMRTLQIKKRSRSGRPTSAQEMRYAMEVRSFVRYYAMSNGNNIYKSGALNWTKEYTNAHRNKPAELLATLEDMLEAARSVRAVKADGKAANGHTVDILAASTSDDVMQTFPLVMAMGGARLQTKEYGELVTLVERLAFISFILDGVTIGGCKYDIIPPIMESCRLLKNDSLTYDEKVAAVKACLTAEMARVRPNFLDALRTYRFQDKGLGKPFTQYILSVLANSLDGGQYTTWTIEHVLPEMRGTPKEDDYVQQVTSLGNLSLVTQSDNSALKDKPFAEKRPIYEKNVQCRLTNSLAKPLTTGTVRTKYDKAIEKYAYVPPVADVWDKAEIDRRTSAMVNLTDYAFFGEVASPTAAPEAPSAQVVITLPAVCEAPKSP